jgi:hypothetical protein
MPASKLGKTRKFYRDGLEEDITGIVRVSVTSDGHVVERYTLANGKKRFFATLYGTHWCAHGNTIADAVTDAMFKDPIQRPSIDSLVNEINKAGKSRKITLSEFRILTGACLAGCKTALERAGRDSTPLTAFDIRDVVSRDWGTKLIRVLGWEDKNAS